MYVCMYVCTYVCMHACMYVCMYVCTPTHPPTYDTCMPTNLAAMNVCNYLYNYVCIKVYSYFSVCKFIFASMHGISKDAFQEYFCNIASEIRSADAYPATECNKIISVFEAPYNYRQRLKLNVVFVKLYQSSQHEEAM